MTSDRGFGGGYNANVLREAQGLKALLASHNVETVPYVTGRKGIGWHRFRGLDMAGEWSGFSDTPANHNASEITRALLEAFERPSKRAVWTRSTWCYTEFVSMLTQQPVVRRLLPLEIEETPRRRPDRYRPTSSSRHLRPSSTRCCPGTWKAASSPRCLTRRPPRSPRGGGP